MLSEWSVLLFPSCCLSPGHMQRAFPWQGDKGLIVNSGNGWTGIAGAFLISLQDDREWPPPSPLSKADPNGQRGPRHSLESPTLWPTASQPGICFGCLFLRFIYLRGGQGARIPSRLRAEHGVLLPAPDAGLDLPTPRSRPELKPKARYLTNCTTQAPRDCFYELWIGFCANCVLNRLLGDFEQPSGPLFLNLQDGES